VPVDILLPALLPQQVVEPKTALLISALVLHGNLPPIEVECES
jgi:hypothetical protein